MERRIYEHNSGLIEGYTSRRRPVGLVFSERFSDIDDAIKFEKQVKGWSRKKKEALINRVFDLLVELSRNKKRKDTVILRQAAVLKAYITVTLIRLLTDVEM